MNKKLIAIDLDGTTLNNHSLITSETKQAIQKVMTQGHIVSIATGRAFRTSNLFYKQLGLDSPMVNYNGAWCHHPLDTHWKNGYHKSLNREIALSLTSFQKYSEVRLISAESRNQVYMDREAYYPYQIDPEKEPLNPLPFQENTLGEDPTSVNIFVEDEKYIPYIQEKVIEQYGNDVEVRTWGGPSPTLEIVSLGIQKAMGVERIAQSYNIDQKDILAFGDEANDYEMIQYAGLGVVMNNGIEALQNIADDVTTYSNHENGLAEYLTNYFEL
ncbi:MAG TPA: Cof-type HAD-IIB family hydrolase [Atopostipes sp.]|nr:Cof-type HAD-IIB family hydrolase [Atopostipes sp.]